MLSLEQTILVALAVWGVACCVYWSAGVYRFVQTRLSAPTAPDADRMPDPPAYPTVCVVIPAHNEQGVIGELLETLKGQDYPAGKLRVVFSLDRCTDGTERVLREGLDGDERVVIHTVTHCPPEWAGKVHALWHAVMNRPEAFDADVILFIDADTLLHPLCIRRCVKLLLARKCGLLSLYSTLAKRYWFERVVQPAAAGELLREYPVLRANKPGARNMANGQFMMFTREAYFSSGTHEAVKGEVLEDTAFAQIVKGVGHRCEVLFADGSLVCRMYETWGDFARGWRRLFIELANRRPGRMAKHVWTIMTTSVAMPVLAMASLGLGLVWMGPENGVWAWAAVACGGAGVAAFYLCMGMGVVFGGASKVGALLYPVGSVLVAWIMATARRELLEGVPVRWGGKEYVRRPRGKDDVEPIRVAGVLYAVPARGTSGGGGRGEVVVRAGGGVPAR